ncbi:hypothetical protein BST61_g11102 [Cercospora zeina]
MKAKLRWESPNLFEYLAVEDDEDDEIPNAATRVFNTFELAEQIFLDVPPRTILVSIQRTCKQFKAVVEGSSPLQQALFFEPISDTRLRLAPRSWRWRCSGKWILTAEEHCGCWYESSSYCLWMHPLIAPVGENDPQYEATFAYDNASWRRQLASQPPISEYILTERHNHGTVATGDSVVTAAGPDGMLFSQIVKLCTGYVRNRPFPELPALVRGLVAYNVDERWAWRHMPAAELLNAIRVSVDNHDQWAGS